MFTKIVIIAVASLSFFAPVEAEVSSTQSSVIMTEMSLSSYAG